MNVRLREARIEDATQLIALRRQLDDMNAEARPDLFVSADYFDEQKIRSCMNDVKSRVIVAVTDEPPETAIAYMILNKEIAPEGILFKTPRMFLYINDLCVGTTHRRQGIGAALMEYAVAYANEIGADALELHVAEFNTNAIRLYESFGLETRNRRMELRLK